MKKVLFYAIGALTLMSFNSCGVIFGGSQYRAHITVKDHPNANIYVNGDKIGTGTAEGLFMRNKPLKVEVKQDGCETKTKEFDKKFRTGNFILSCITWWVIGAGVDLGTGAAYKPNDSDPNVKRLSTKDFSFNIDYFGCPTK